MARLEPCIGVDEAEDGLVFGIGGLEPFGGFGQVIGHVGDQRCVVIAEHREAAVLQAVDRRQGLLLVPLPRKGPGGEQRGRDVVLPAGAAAREFMPGRHPMAILHLADAEHHVGQAVLGVDLDEPAPEVEPIVDVAIGQGSHEGALDQLRIMRVGAQHFLEIGSGGLRVAVGTRHQGRQVIARYAASDVERGGRDHHGFAGLEPRQRGRASQKQDRETSGQARRGGAHRGGLGDVIGHGNLGSCEAARGRDTR